MHDIRRRINHSSLSTALALSDLVNLFVHSHYDL